METKWHAAWRSHGQVSLDPLDGRGVGGYTIETQLREMVEEEESWSQLGIKVETHDWDQYSANPERGALQMGSSACAFIQGHFVLDFLLKGVVHVTRDLLASLVDEYDSAGRPKDGSFARTEVLVRGERLGIPLIVTEPPLDSRTGFPQPIHRPRHLSDALEAFSTEHGLRFACALTCSKSGGTGNAFGLFVHKYVTILDMHNRRDLLGNRQGTCLATFEHRDFTTVSNWIFQVLLPCMGCAGSVDIVAVSVCCETQVKLTVAANPVLQRIVALKELTNDPRMLPGDFLIDSCGHHALLQLCLTGMKLFFVTQHILASMEVFNAH